jgi:hypothetical protein
MLVAIPEAGKKIGARKQTVTGYDVIPWSVSRPGDDGTAREKLKGWEARR